MSAPYGSVGLFSGLQARDRFLEWGAPPHNPHEGKFRPAFSWPAFYRYANGEVDADGTPINAKAEAGRMCDRGSANPRNG